MTNKVEQNCNIKTKNKKHNDKEKIKNLEDETYNEKKGSYIKQNSILNSEVNSNQEYKTGKRFVSKRY